MYLHDGAYKNICPQKAHENVRGMPMRVAQAAWSLLLSSEIT